MAETKNLPVEVELALQVMPCQAMHRAYSAGEKPHACAHFAEWGVFHTFDYNGDGPPPRPGIAQASNYAGKRPVVPEILSGCRKAPILAVGINPNLPGWSPSTRSAIHPYFEDYLQYAHYFRWRATDKLRIPAAAYQALRQGRDDGPFDRAPLTAEGTAISVEPTPVTMYGGYQSLLDGLAAAQGWANHSLGVGEDIAYANMVACGSARWTTRPVDDMPVMGEAGARAIVRECFSDRKYFLRQMLQSLPAVVIVFSQTTADAFITAMQGRFTKGDPEPGEKLPALLAREIRLRLGTTADGAPIDTRVIFSPHASANPQEFAAQRAAIVAQLSDEVNAGGLALNPGTGHLARTRGGCQFCDNALYSIGPCDYRAELQPLSAGAAIQPLAESGRAATAAERAEHERLTAEFTAAPPAAAGFTLLDAEAPFAPKLALLGDIVTMNGPPIAGGAIYLHRGEIVAVQAAAAPPPAGFETVTRIDTGGVIYPGLLDLHNHLAYNAVSLWQTTRARANRRQWRNDPEYTRRVSEPMKIINNRPDLVKAVVRYVEVKLALGGVTSGQGMNGQSGTRLNYRGGVRNFEQPDDAALPRIYHQLNDLPGRPDDIDHLRGWLDSGAQVFMHLAEGTDVAARRQFEMVRDNGFLRSNFVGIHSLGLERADLDQLAAAGGAVVWSPLSNSVLYGRSLNVADLLGSGVKFALGSDWTPSGSRNILSELKVARLTAEGQGVDLSAERLAHAVTADAATLAGWGDKVGRLTAGRYADLLVLDRKHADPYENLLHATEREVRLVVIAGHPRHGDRALMDAAGIPAAQLEPITVGGSDKALNLMHRASPLNHVGFEAARDALSHAFADLPAARDVAVFEPFSAGPELKLDLDLQSEEAAVDAMGLLADLPPLDSILLDAPTVIDDPGYWAVLDGIGHLPASLKGPNGLRRFYG